MDKLNQGYSVAIATIIDSKGSVPGKPGAKISINQKWRKNMVQLGGLVWS